MMVIFPLIWCLMMMMMIMELKCISKHRLRKVLHPTQLFQYHPQSVCLMMMMMLRMVVVVVVILVQLGSTSSNTDSQKSAVLYKHCKPLIGSRVVWTWGPW